MEKLLSDEKKIQNLMPYGDKGDIDQLTNTIQNASLIDERLNADKSNDEELKDIITSIAGEEFLAGNDTVNRLLIQRVDSFLKFELEKNV